MKHATAEPRTQDAGLTLFYERFPGARQLWHLTDKKKGGGYQPGPDVDAYAVNGRVLILVQYRGREAYYDGWDIFAPVSDSNEVVATLDAAAGAAGLLPPR